ncbi:chorismate lyase [Parathermosynechococcus lividus]|uniref:Chorismate lyase n=1 Tax=Parathermosynechococcus lividus PCC 6715 TaxID=1917166 RepID=A0A2D2Q1L7_PARLV|nr:chorismate lyase [Thermostichus lividus]ATS18388.1 chorismate lyase [Thermostichus lividus PCC 6715]MCH9056417.1 chorismate lyase [Synechococcus sp. PCC 6716]
MTASLLPSTTSSSWHALEPLWQGDFATIQQGLPHDLLAPAWQILILGDGSPTRHLQLLTREATEVDVIDMSAIGHEHDAAPPQLQLIPGPRLRRQVWLRTASGQRLAYAASWWEAAHVDEYLQNRAMPIWTNLAQRKVELYRDIQAVYFGHCDTLAAAFGEAGPFWGRHYLFWHDRRPLTLIYEVFSPYLCRYLGPMGSTLDSLQAPYSDLNACR